MPRPHKKRAYDAGIPHAILVEARERRVNPTGVEHPVETRLRGDKEIQKFPWKKLELGDFFFARILGNEKSLRIQFHQAAARHDFELTVVKMEIDGNFYLRVTVSLLDVLQYKKRARGKGARNIGFSDGRWRRRREAEYKRRKAEGADTSVSARGTEGRTQAGPQWSSDDAPLPDTGTPPPETPMSRQEKLRLALARAGATLNDDTV